jgi:hypothetical protein
VWFTIEHPVPPTFPQAHKYTNNDVDMLPWSYTLSSIPALLRDSSDNTVSKVYTLPRTKSLPYPSLPISFPDLALYLQEALDEAQRYQDDSSTGMYKLAKMIGECYPELADEDEEDRRQENLSKRVNSKKLNKIVSRRRPERNPKK